MKKSSSLITELLCLSIFTAQQNFRFTNTSEGLRKESEHTFICKDIQEILNFEGFE